MSLWRRAGRYLDTYRGHILILAGVAAFALGCVGQWLYLNDQIWRGNPRNPGLTDIGFWSIRLFFGAAPMKAHLPWELDVARYVALIVAGYAGFRAIALLSRDRIQQLRIPLMRGHIVVCGLGYIGTAFVHEIHAKGLQVVVIDSDASNQHIELCRSLKVPVLNGDAQLERTLQAAGVGRASRILAVTHLDAINAQIVVTARRAASSCGNVRLRCLARIRQPGLCELLQTQVAVNVARVPSGRQPSRPDDERRVSNDGESLLMDPLAKTTGALASNQGGAGAGLPLEFFNTDEIGADLLLLEFPVSTEHGQPHILIGDLGPLGAMLVARAARAWYRTRKDTTLLVVTVVDDFAEQQVRALRDHYPGMDETCRFIVCTTAEADLQRLANRQGGDEAPPVSRAYVCAERDEQAIEMALTLRNILDASIPVVVALSRSYGVAMLLSDMVVDGSNAKIDIFPTLDRICTVDLIEGGAFESMAGALHDHWPVERRAGDKPAVSWAEAKGSHKDAHRAHARRLAATLRNGGYAIVPQRDWTATQTEFSDEEIEQLAASEYHRQPGGQLVPDQSSAQPSSRKRRSAVKGAELRDVELLRGLLRELPRVLDSAGLRLIRVLDPLSTT